MSWDLHPGQPPLTDAERTMMLESLRHFDGVHFDLLASLVLDEKVYVLVRPYPDRPLERTVGGWKRWASGQFGIGGRAAPFWRGGYFDRIMRGPEEVARRIEQLRRLPALKWPEAKRYEWMWARGEGAGAPTGAPAVE